MRNRSTTKVVASAIGIKSWRARVPSANEVRPARCVGCDAASCPIGSPKVVHGQGLCLRQVRGVVGLEDEPGVVEIEVRKFECQRCGSVMTVVPSELVPRRQYSAPSIALALYLWLVEGQSDSAVRARVCAWRVVSRRGTRGWAQLYRWARTAAMLFPLVRPIANSASVRAIAIAVIDALSSLAPVATISSPMSARVFAGAARVATMAIASA